MLRSLAAAVERLPANLGAQRDVHNERIKLLSSAAHAIGLSILIGGFLGPLFNANAARSPLGGALAIAFWLLLFLTALWLLRYTWPKD